MSEKVKPIDGSESDLNFQTAAKGDENRLNLLESINDKSATGDGGITNSVHFRAADGGQLENAGDKDDGDETENSEDGKWPIIIDYAILDHAVVV